MMDETKCVQNHIGFWLSCLRSDAEVRARLTWARVGCPPPAGVRARVTVAARARVEAHRVAALTPVALARAERQLWAGLPAGVVH